MEPSISMRSLEIHRAMQLAKLEAGDPKTLHSNQSTSRGNAMDRKLRKGNEAEPRWHDVDSNSAPGVSVVTVADDWLWICRSTDDDNGANFKFDMKKPRKTRASQKKESDLVTLKKHVVDSLDTGDWVIIDEGVIYREIPVDVESCTDVGDALETITDKYLGDKILDNNNRISADSGIDDVGSRKSENPDENLDNHGITLNSNSDLLCTIDKNDEIAKYTGSEIRDGRKMSSAEGCDCKEETQSSREHSSAYVREDTASGVFDKININDQDCRTSLSSLSATRALVGSSIGVFGDSLHDTAVTDNVLIVAGGRSECNCISKAQEGIKECKDVRKPRCKVTPLRKQLPKEQEIRNRRRSWTPLSPVKKLVLLFSPKGDSKTKCIQEIDGGFFERFGSLLRQHTVRAALEESTPLAPLPEESAVLGAASGEEGSTAPALDSDSGNETLPDTDSEPEEPPDGGRMLNDAVGWNIDELYEEVLFAILHNIGCDEGCESGREALLSYLQDAFKMAAERHDALLAAAEEKEAPEIRLNVEVVEGKDLHPKDPNGMSDPFVTMYLQSSPAHRYNTSVQGATLNPQWEEHFSLPLDDHPQEDVLCLEVWDFDPAETVREKISKLFEVRGVRGLRKLMKEIAVTASTGKHDNELIGRAQVPLKSVPASGMTMWYGLDKKNKPKRQGVLKVRLAFSAEKDTRVAAQEHRHLLRVLLLHELESSKVTQFWWSGSWCTQARAIITQHRAQGGLSPVQAALCEWSVFCRVHADHALSLELFSRLLRILVKPLQQKDGQLEQDGERLFWEGACRLLPSCFQLVRKIRKKTAGDKASLKTLKEALEILQLISMLEPPEGTDLLPARVYGWMERAGDTSPCWDIRHALVCAVRSAARSWFVHILDNNEACQLRSACTSPTEDVTTSSMEQALQRSRDGADQPDGAGGEDALRRLVRLIQLVRSDLQRALEYFDKLFQEIVSLPYASTLYQEYETRLSDLVGPEVQRVCRTLHRVDYSPPRGTSLTSPAQDKKEPLAMGTTLFELYLVIKRFVVLGEGLCPTSDYTKFAIRSYHSWFAPGVAHWLDIAAYKAMCRVDKAVELDPLRPVTDDVKYSSSAVDSLAIFYQIKIFWEQLEWPDAEGSYTFVAKIVDDICRCCVFYADRTAGRVSSPSGSLDEMTPSSPGVAPEARFRVTDEWCLAINNIDYVRQSLRPFVQELDVDGIIARLADYRSPEEAERCRATLLAVIENAVDTVRNKILDLVETLARKMSPALRRFLLEGAELLQTDCNSLERLLLYLEDSLATLHAALNADNFARVVSAVWCELSTILYDLVQQSLEKRRPPSFYSNLLGTLDVMNSSFGFGGSCSKLMGDQTDCSAADKDEKLEQEELDKAALEDMRALLRLHGLETAQLIHRFHLDRWREQQNMKDTPYGVLTVRCHFEESTLHIEIMNARNLKPMDTNGSCDPFVRICLLPEDRFVGTPKPKTQSQNKTMFPLYDEKFTITLSEEQMSCDDGLISFNVKDKDFLSNQYMAEAFLKLSELPRGAPGPQTHLTLTRPTVLDSDTSKALENRQGDRQAREFLKKLRLKMTTT